MTNQTIIIDDIEITGLVTMADGSTQDIRDVDFGAMVMEALSRDSDTASLGDFFATHAV